VVVAPAAAASAVARAVRVAPVAAAVAVVSAIAIAARATKPVSREKVPI
jgi:hypothetical protein